MIESIFGPVLKVKKMPISRLKSIWYLKNIKKPLAVPWSFGIRLKNEPLKMVNQMFSLDEPK
jgi:hypothetical protein